MRALEFKTKFKNNQIQIPSRIQDELKKNHDKNIRVIVLIEESDLIDDMIFQESTKNYFLKGYAESDSIYDNY